MVTLGKNLARGLYPNLIQLKLEDYPETLIVGTWFWILNLITIFIILTLTYIHWKIYILKPKWGGSGRVCGFN